jgi:hypothetical protein
MPATNRRSALAHLNEHLFPAFLELLECGFIAHRIHAPPVAPVAVGEEDHPNFRWVSTLLFLENALHHAAR